MVFATCGKCHKTMHRQKRNLNLEEVEAHDGIYEAVDVVGSSGRPLEAEAIEDLCGVVVGRFYPARGFPKQPDSPMRMAAHKKRQNWMLNPFFSSIVIFL